MKPTQTHATAAVSVRPRLFSTANAYLRLIKSRQTLLLLATGLTGWLSAWSDAPRAPVAHLATGSLTQPLLMMLSLSAAISGTTALNMVLDRDIDAAMSRTAHRPLPTAALSLARAAFFGACLVLLGLGIAFLMSAPFGAVILVGVVFDLLLYTVWLKRRTPWAILVGGLSGGLPILAGRVLATGRPDALGLVLGLSVVTWIPSHVVSLTIRYADEYRRGGVPTLPDSYGIDVACRFVALSDVLRLAILLIAGSLLGLGTYALFLVGLSSAVMAGLSLWRAHTPSARLNHVLFKAASVHMLGSMVLLTFGGSL